MDDLATTERSLREVWAEVNHGRFSLNKIRDILKEVSIDITQQHMIETIEKQKQQNERSKLGSQTTTTFISEVKKTKLSPKDIPIEKISEILKWVPVATYFIELFLSLKQPPKNITELILATTLNPIHNSADPLKELHAFDPYKYPHLKPVSKL